MRPECVVYIAVSVDGYIARPDGGLDWLADVQADAEDYGYATFFAEIDTILLGRATWDTVAAFPEWPFVGKRVVVMTNRPIDLTHGETAASGPLAPVLAQLAADGARRVYVDGGATIRAALAEGVVDRLTLSVIPRVLGDGIRLFDRGIPELPLRLVDHRAFPSGLVQLTWVPRPS